MMLLDVFVYGVIFGIGIGFGVYTWDFISETTKKMIGRYIHIG